MKTLIAVQGVSSTGKSSTCIEFARILLRTYPNHQILEASPQPNLFAGGDIRLVVKLNNSTVAVESQGDPGTNLDLRLNEIITNYNPDIIVTTCRSSRETVNIIERLTQYDKIYTAPYKYNEIGPNQAAMRINLNELKGKQILELLQVLNRI